MSSDNSLKNSLLFKVWPYFDSFSKNDLITNTNTLRSNDSLPTLQQVLNINVFFVKF